MSVKGLTQRNNYDASRKMCSEPTVIDNTLQDYMNKSILQLKHNRKILKCKQAKVSLIALRNNWKRQQGKLNYQSEYDRISGLLGDSVLKGTSTMHIRKKDKHITENGCWYASYYKV